MRTPTDARPASPAAENKVIFQLWQPGPDNKRLNEYYISYGKLMTYDPKCVHKSSRYNLCISPSGDSMGADARLNLLLTPPARSGGKGQPWHQTLSQLLMPLGVRTFEASDGPHAVELIERYPIHLAVVDARLPTISGINVLQLVQRLRQQQEQAQKADPAQPGASGPGVTGGFHFQMHVEEKTQPGETQRRIEVRFDARPAKPVGGPVVILIAPPPPQQDPQFLQEALKFNAFSVLSEPVDVNLALEVMARALKRFHQNQWPV